MRIVSGLFIGMMTLALMSPAKAEACYSKQEAEAEQGIRILSELMVIGLNCQHMTPEGDKNFYAQYLEFMGKHKDLFMDYEERLIDYYERSGVRNPEDSLNDLRTDLANKISMDAANMRPDIFCSRYVERLQKTARMDQNRIKKWASTFYPSHPVSKPICQP